MARTSFTLLMLGVAGSMALLLGVVGILWRDRLFRFRNAGARSGIRMALGAAAAVLTNMFRPPRTWLTGIGVVCGLAAAIIADGACMSSLPLQGQPGRSPDLHHRLPRPRTHGFPRQLPPLAPHLRPSTRWKPSARSKRSVTQLTVHAGSRRSA